LAVLQLKYGVIDDFVRILRKGETDTNAWEGGEAIVERVSGLIETLQEGSGDFRDLYLHRRNCRRRERCDSSFFTAYSRVYRNLLEGNFGAEIRYPL